MMEIRVPFRKVVNLIYEKNFDEFFENFYMESDFINKRDNLTKHSLELFNEIVMNNDELKNEIKYMDEDEINDLIINAMRYRYEYSYMNDLFSHMINEYKKTMLNDFDDLNSLIIYDDIQFDLYTDDDKAIKQHDYLKNNFTVEIDDDYKSTESGEMELVISGSIEKLALCIIGVIHGYGMFRFTSINEFNDQYLEDDLDINSLAETCINHLHWLKHVPEIYGVDTFVQPNVEHIETCNILGDMDFTEDDVYSALENF